MTVRILHWHSAGEHRSSFIDSEGSAAPSLLFPVVTISRHLDGGLRTGQAYVIFPPKIFPTHDCSQLRELSIGLVCFVILSLARCPKQWAVSREFPCIYSFLWLCRAPFHALHLTPHTTSSGKLHRLSRITPALRQEFLAMCYQHFSPSATALSDLSVLSKKTS